MSFSANEEFNNVFEPEGGVKVLPLAAILPVSSEAPAPVVAKIADTVSDTAAGSPDSLSDVISMLDGKAPVMPDAVSAVAQTAPSTDASVNAPVIAESKLKIALKALRSTEDQIRNIIRLLEEDAPADMLADMTRGPASEFASREFSGFATPRPTEGRVVEGVFDGLGMVGSDGVSYPVPPNYASKSKLVEGDMLKLIITPKGSFIFKQIGPIERSRIVGHLGYDQTIGEWYVAEADRRWNVLKASVTFYKGEPDDETVVLVPKNAPSKWAAIENILKNNQPII